MDVLKIVTTVLSACLLLAAQCSCTCDDIDTKACEAMAVQNSNLCNDPTLSTTACPKYCNKCSLVCYHCDSSVRNYKDCNTTRACQAGEQCLMHQLVSSNDGHREYRMSCASIDTCDGNGIMLTGRRSINSRNLITQCCSSDLCNYPNFQQPTSLPSCQRDIEILTEDSRDTSSSAYIIGYLKDLVSRIEIGPHQNQIGVALYDDDVNKMFDLGTYSYTPDLLKAIDGIVFTHNENDIDKGDVIEFLEDHLRKGHHGDRSDYEDVVIIIADHFPHRHVRYLRNHEPKISDLSSISKDVIVINVGAGDRTSVFSALASNANHVIDVPNYPSLATSLPQVLSLLCL